MFMKLKKQILIESINSFFLEKKARKFQSKKKKKIKIEILKSCVSWFCLKKINYSLVNEQI